MKQWILGILLFALLVIGGIWLTLKFYEPNIKSFFSPKAEVTGWQYKGHDMLRYEYKGSCSVCHSPVCKKCYQIYD